MFLFLLTAVFKWVSYFQVEDQSEVEECTTHDVTDYTDWTFDGESSLRLRKNDKNQFL